MRQLLRMRARWVFCLLGVVVSGCSLPAPYQTYTAGPAVVPTAPTNPMVVYGATTTEPDMVPDSGEVEPVPAPSDDTAAVVPASGTVAICYNRLWNAPNAIKAAALQACGGGNISPRVTSQNTDIDACPLLTPTKATFACNAPPTH